MSSFKKITEEQFRLTSVRKLAVKLNYQHDENSHAVFFKEWSISNSIQHDRFWKKEIFHKIQAVTIVTSPKKNCTHIFSKTLNFDLSNDV